MAELSGFLLCFGGLSLLLLSHFLQLLGVERLVHAMAEGQWIIFSDPVGPEHCTQVIRLGSRCFSLLSHVTSSAGF